MNAKYKNVKDEMMFTYENINVEFFFGNSFISGHTCI